MTIQYTRWYPDSCACVFMYEWDDTLPGKGRIHKLVAVERRCEEPAHQTPSNDELYNIVIEECNVRKSQAFVISQQILPRLTPEQVLWFYDHDRILHIRFQMTVNTLEKEMIEAAFDVAFGPRKVIVE